MRRKHGSFCSDKFLYGLYRNGALGPAKVGTMASPSRYATISALPLSDIYYD